MHFELSSKNVRGGVPGTPSPCVNRINVKNEITTHSDPSTSIFIMTVSVVRLSSISWNKEFMNQSLQSNFCESSNNHIDLQFHGLIWLFWLSITIWPFKHTFFACFLTYFFVGIYFLKKMCSVQNVIELK